MKRKIRNIVTVLAVACFLIPPMMGCHVTHLPSTSGTNLLTPRVTPFEIPYARSVVSTNNTLSYLGQIGGIIDGLSIQGDYAYIGSGPRLVILDISNPTAPTKVGETSPLPGIVVDVAVSGNYAYIAAEGSGLRIIDVHRPEAPSEVGYLVKEDSVTSVAIDGDYAYIANSRDGLRVIDISSPSHPVEVDHNYFPNGAYDVTIQGNYAYVGGRYIVDISNPSKTYEVGRLDSDVGGMDVAVQSNYAYLACSDGLRIVDVSVPSNMKLVKFLWIDTTDAVAVAGNYAFLGNLEKGLLIYDISDPINPAETAIFNLQNIPNHIVTVGNYAYYTDNVSFHIIDINRPAAPKEIGYYIPHTTVSDVVVRGNYAYAAGTSGGLAILDVSAPEFPILVSFVETPGPSNTIKLDGDYAYVASKAGLSIFNVNDPSSPIKIAFVKTKGLAIDVDLLGNYAFLADSDTGLRILDVSTHHQPTQVGLFAHQGWMRVEVAGDYAYLIYGNYDLHIIDISTPGKPEEVGQLYTPYLRFDIGSIAVVGNQAFALRPSHDLFFLDVTSPDHPVTERYCVFERSTSTVSVFGDYAYIASIYPSGPFIIDITSPQCLAYEYAIPGGAKKIDVVQDRVYVVSFHGGLVVLEFHPPN